MFISFWEKMQNIKKYSLDKTSVWILLTSFGDKNLQSYNIVQNLSETFHVYIFLTFYNVCFLSKHGELVQKRMLVY